MRFHTACVIFANVAILVAACAIDRANASQLVIGRTAVLWDTTTDPTTTDSNVDHTWDWIIRNQANPTYPSTGGSSFAGAFPGGSLTTVNDVNGQPRNVFQYTQSVDNFSSPIDARPEPLNAGSNGGTGSVLGAWGTTQATVIARATTTTSNASSGLGFWLNYDQGSTGNANSGTGTVNFRLRSDGSQQIFALFDNGEASGPIVPAVTGLPLNHFLKIVVGYNGAYSANPGQIIYSIYDTDAGNALLATNSASPYTHAFKPAGTGGGNDTFPTIFYFKAAGDGNPGAQIDAVSVVGDFIQTVPSRFNWTGTADANWNTTSTNWSGTATTFSNTFTNTNANTTSTNAVLFDDSGTNTSIAVTTPVTPASVAFNNTAAKSYSLTSSGGNVIGDAASSGGVKTTLIKQNVGTATLIGPNTYSGGSAVTNGVLLVGSSSNGAGTGITNGPLGTGSVLVGDFQGSNSAGLLFNTTSGLTLANNISIQDGNSGTSTVGGQNTGGTNTFSGNITLGVSAGSGKNVALSAAPGGTVDFTGVIRNNLADASAGVSVVGGGTVILSNTNTYKGVTNVVDGALVVNGSITSQTTVGTSGALKGIGTIIGNVSGTGAVAPGNSIGTLHVNGTYGLTGSGINDFEISKIGVTRTGDLINQISTLTYGGNLQISLAAGSDAIGTFADGDNWNLFDFGTRSGASVFGNDGEFGTAGGSFLPTLNGNLNWAFDYGTGILSVVAVPEPGSFTLLIVGLLSCRLFRVRRAR